MAKRKEFWVPTTKKSTGIKKGPTGKKTTDPVFGDLTRSVTDLWERKISIRLFGRDHSVSLFVNIDEDEGLKKSQIRAYETFTQNAEQLLSNAEVALLDYYQSVCDEYRDQLGVTARKHPKVPLITKVEELAKLVEPEAVVFRYGHSRPTFGLLLKCTWEEEHGVAVKFVNDKIIEVGFQDIVL
jgi:hypothetical protein